MEIKFRSFYENSQTFVYMTVGQIMTDEGKKIYDKMCIDGVQWEQFTGIKDDTGKEIYGGDIVIIDTISDKKRNVVFRNGGFRIEFKTITGIVSYHIDNFRPEELKVVGNIYIKDTFTNKKKIN